MSQHERAAIALRVKLVAAHSGVLRLQAAEPMQPHAATLGGVAATLRWLSQAAPISAQAYLDLGELAEDLRDIWGAVRCDRPEANALCKIDVALQHARGIIAAALRDSEHEAQRLLAQVEVGR
jgi:hypothetical protein